MKTPTVAEAIRFAIADALQVSQDSPNELHPREEQFRSAMYMHFKCKGCVVHVEAAYPRSRSDCDLRVRLRNGKQWWIEIKAAWCIRAWNNKPSEQRRTWAADVKKLRRAPARASRFFVLFGVFDDRAHKIRSPLPEIIDRFYPGNLCWDSGWRDFRWPHTPIRKLRAWAWRF